MPAVAAVVSAQGGAPGVALLHVHKVLVGAAGRVAAVFTHKDLGSSLSVGVLLVNAVNLPRVGLEGAPLGEGFLTQLTLVRTNPCSSGDVTGLDMHVNQLGEEVMSKFKQLAVEQCTRHIYTVELWGIFDLSIFVYRG